MSKKSKFKMPSTWREIEIEKARREGRAEGYAWGYDAAQYTMHSSNEELKELNSYALCPECKGVGINVLDAKPCPDCAGCGFTGPNVTELRED